MAATASAMLELGTDAPDFVLPDANGRTHRLSDFIGAEVLVVIFMCNHCPFVKHLGRAFAQIERDYKDKSVAIVGINSNDIENYPDDAPPKMTAFQREYGLSFAYLYDESQSVAKAFHAACTPDFYVFARERKLFYRGQFDESRPKSETPITGADLRNAIDAALRGDDPPSEQQPSLGCNIKWKPGNEPEYFTG